MYLYKYGNIDSKVLLKKRNCAGRNSTTAVSSENATLFEQSGALECDSLKYSKAAAL